MEKRADMKLQVVRQAITKESLFDVIAKWCRAGSGETSFSLRFISAFASGAGVAALSPLFDVFLARGNRIEIICGIDRQGTDADAIRRLHALQETHQSGMSVCIFNAPSKSAIFHPKLYIFEHGTRVDFVIGSSNMTSGGLGANFESLLLYRNLPRRSPEARCALSIWRTFSHPRPPILAEYLRPLNMPERTRLLSVLPKKSAGEKRSTLKQVTELWRPLSQVKLPHSVRVQHRSPPSSKSLQGRYLLMDVLHETRKTQMQIPLAVVKGFFGLTRRQRADISVAMWSPDGLTQPIKRPIVISEGPNMERLMRRIEVPQIKTLKRKLAILFVKLKGHRKFVYRVIPRESSGYRLANLVLERHGQQGRNIRRYVIGRKGDLLWKQVNKLLPRWAAP